VSLALTVLGGGPAGLAVAAYAGRLGTPVVLFERDLTVGGLCRTFDCGPHRYDAGAHRFHDRDPGVTSDVRALLGDRLRAVDAPSRVYAGGRFVAFPPTPLGMLLSGGVGEAHQIALDLLRARRRRECVSFADFAVGRFGETLARRFLIGYTEKLWGMPAEELSPDVATRRLAGMTLHSLLVELLMPWRRARHVDGRFLYPVGGYGELPRALAALAPPGALRTGHAVTRLESRDGRIVAVHFAEAPPFAVRGRVCSTLPLTSTVRLLGDALPERAHRIAASLRFRSVRLVFVRLARARVSRNASIYFPDPALCVARASEPKNRSAAMAPADETSLVVEVPCSAGDPLAVLPAEALAARVVDELRSVGLVRPAEVMEWRHHLLPNAYPVYSLGWEQRAAELVAELARVRNLDLLGRGGLFLYSHLHDQIRFGKEYAARLTESPRLAGGASG